MLGGPEPAGFSSPYYQQRHLEMTSRTNNDGDADDVKTGEDAEDEDEDEYDLADKTTRIPFSPAIDNSYPGCRVFEICDQVCTLSAITEVLFSPPEGKGILQSDGITFAPPPILALPRHFGGQPQ